MKLGFQGYFLTRPYTGIGVHCRGILRELAKEKSVKLRVLVPEPVKVPGLSKRKIQVLPMKNWIPHPALRKWYWERVQVPAAFAEMDLDWELYSYPTPLPRVTPHKRAVTVHDLVLWTDPRYQGNTLKQRYHQDARKSLVRADQIFTVSESTKRILDIPTAVVLGNSVPEIPKKLPELDYENSLVYLGGYDIRKQVPQLVEAFQKIRKQHPDLHLQLIGKPHHQSRYYPAVPQAENVHVLGPLSDEQVYAALKSAFAFIHFSDAEGFNIPLLQAMKIGTPAIVPKLPVNEEVAGGSAAFFDPSKIKSLSAIIKTLKKPAARKKIIAAQKTAARRYTWKKSARTLLKTLKS